MSSPSQEGAVDGRPRRGLLDPLGTAEHHLVDLMSVWDGTTLSRKHQQIIGNDNIFHKGGGRSMRYLKFQEEKRSLPADYIFSH